MRDAVGEASQKRTENGIPSTRNSGHGNLEMYSRRSISALWDYAPKPPMGSSSSSRFTIPFLSTALRTRVHQNAAGARKDAPEADKKQHIGTSRGGPNTKIHALGNDALEMVAFEITGGQVHDSKMTIPLLEASNIAFVYFNADKAYGGKKIRENVKNLNAEMTYPNKSNAKTIYEFNKERYKERNVVERYFQKLKCCRRIATRYDKLACVYRAFIYLASILIKIKIKTRETELRRMSYVDG